MKISKRLKLKNEATYLKQARTKHPFVLKTYAEVVSE
jgi:hypothetical protein